MWLPSCGCLPRHRSPRRPLWLWSGPSSLRRFGCPSFSAVSSGVSSGRHRRPVTRPVPTTTTTHTHTHTHTHTPRDTNPHAHPNLSPIFCQQHGVRLSAHMQHHWHLAESARVSASPPPFLDVKQGRGMLNCCVWHPTEPRIPTIRSQRALRHDNCDAMCHVISSTCASLRLRRTE